MDSGRSSPLLINELNSLDLAEVDLSAIFERYIQHRHGTVLTRNTILKSDHFTKGDQVTELNLVGSPNFRQTLLNIYGVAQPTAVGLQTILCLLNMNPVNEKLTSPNCIWFSTREEPFIYINGIPYVLRDQTNPFFNIKSYSGISGSRLEMVENRLKRDVLRESLKSNGLILVHLEETQQKIVPCIVAAESVKTPKELFESFVERGFSLKYYRIPMPHEHSPIEDFIDEYVQIFHNATTQDRVVFSCGIGVGRTTYGMVLGCLIRRLQLIIENGEDPFGKPSINSINQDNRILLRLVYVLEQGLHSKMSPHSAIEWALDRGAIIDELTAAIKGNYFVIMQLVRVLEGGIACKDIVDEAINQCESLTNIREQILIYRIQYSINLDMHFIELGIEYLERYFSLITFCAFFNEIAASKKIISFSRWMREHKEIWGLLQSIRGKKDKLELFRPLQDLTSLSNRQRSFRTAISRRPCYLQSIDEAQGIIKNRSGAVLISGTILKIDHWDLLAKSASEVPGAPNFRKIDHFQVYTTAQPTLNALDAILDIVRNNGPSSYNICWINVREEPLVYIKGEPYVLRDQHATLRNIQSYSGINQTRLEQMETRLKEDILAEVRTYTGRLLLHDENGEGIVQPHWEDIDDADEILSVRELFDEIKVDIPSLHYYRIPVTAEDLFEPNDIEQIMNVIIDLPTDSLSIVFNCQCGVGRSTFGAVLALQVLNWKTKNYKLGLQYSSVGTEFDISLHYKIINGLLRVVSNGLECKDIVDYYIDMASDTINLRQAIEESRLPDTSDTLNKRRTILKGIAYLKRYFMLIVFQVYLESFEYGETKKKVERFSTWFHNHQEFQTLLDELDKNGNVETLLIDDHHATHESIEAINIVKTREGSVLAPLTILKYDHFPGCQKITLSELIEGAPNFRCVTTSSIASFQRIYGIAMPTEEAIGRLMDRLDRGAGKAEKCVLWVCLREEPVIFLNGKPYVLRVVKDPVTNLEMTGILSERVELMETRLKKDVIGELEKYGNKIIIHDETLDENSRYITMPTWEHVNPESVATPSEAFSQHATNRLQLSYARVPITDEQAPIPSVFDQLLRLISSQTSNTDFIFNCQMGRGRTTTGMIIAMLYLTIRNTDMRFVRFQPNRQESSEKPFGREGTNTRKVVGYLNGEYKLIIQLLQILEFGKLAKKLTDYAIDSCSHIQNIREAIYDFKLRVESVQAGLKEKETTDDKEFQDLTKRGLNYLIRYFYIIVFANFLLEEIAVAEFWEALAKDSTYALKDIPVVNTKEDGERQDEKTGRLQLNRSRFVNLSAGSRAQILKGLKGDRKEPQLFSEWLEERRELQNLVKSSTELGFK